MAIVLPKFPFAGLSGGATRQHQRPPRLLIRLVNPSGASGPVQVLPGGELQVEYRLVGTTWGRVRALELSVLWYTEGKGNEDTGLHHFHRLTEDQLPIQQGEEPDRFQVQLPQAPLSYEGSLIKIRWVVRGRLLLSDGGEVLVDRIFRLGPPARSN